MLAGDICQQGREPGSLDLGINIEMMNEARRFENAGKSSDLSIRMDCDKQRLILS